MSTPTPFTQFLGIDWAADAHELCLLLPGDAQRRSLSIPHSSDGFAKLLTWLSAEGAGAGTLAVAIERPDHPLVDLLLGASYAVFSINPKQADRFRDRHSVAGAKDDRLDAFVLADALRHDLPKFHQITPFSAEHVALKHTLRRRNILCEERQRQTNRLWTVLQLTAPGFLTLSPGALDPFFWELVDLALDPKKAASLRPARVTKLLKEHRIRRIGATEVLTLLRAPRLPIPLHSLEQAMRDARMLIALLRTIDTELRLAESELKALVAAAGDDAKLIDSLPGADIIVTATFLSEAHDAIAQRALAGLRARAGTAPVTRRSGRSSFVSMRRACNPLLRNACFAMARTAAAHDAWAKALYKQMRARGLDYYRALRGIADRLLLRLVAILRTGKPYRTELNPVPESAERA